MDMDEGRRGLIGWLVDSWIGVIESHIHMHPTIPSYLKCGVPGQAFQPPHAAIHRGEREEEEVDGRPEQEGEEEAEAQGQGGGDEGLVVFVFLGCVCEGVFG
jgi:hypothetical protein